MSALRKIKRKLVKAMVANPHRRRFLIKHQEIISDIDPKRLARKWVASKFSRKVISKKAIQIRLQKMLKKTELVYINNQSHYEVMNRKTKDGK